MSEDPKDPTCQQATHGFAKYDGEPGSCPTCGRPRCRASANSRPGERCRNFPKPELTVCVFHGGNTEAAKAKSAELVQEKAAQGLLSKRLWNHTAEPVQSSAVEMRQFVGQLKHWVHVLGQQLGEDACEHCGRSPEPMDGPTARMLQFAAREFRQGLTDMEKHGLAAQFVEVEAGKVRLMATGVGRMFDALELSAEQRELGTRVLMETLRAADDAEQAVVLGEVQS